jgi:putative transposase
MRETRYRRVHIMLRREGWLVNMKRVRRRYRLEGLQLRHKLRRRKHASQHRGIPPAASRAHERWSMDLSMMHCMTAERFGC